jgi:hypothetical protein
MNMKGEWENPFALISRERSHSGRLMFTNLVMSLNLKKGRTYRLVLKIEILYKLFMHFHAIF